MYATQTFHYQPTQPMRPHFHGDIDDPVPHKQRLQGTLAGFGLGGDIPWRLIFFVLKLSEFPETLKRNFNPAQKRAKPTLHHEHL